FSAAAATAPAAARAGGRLFGGLLLCRADRFAHRGFSALFRDGGRFIEEQPGPELALRVRRLDGGGGLLRLFLAVIRDRLGDALAVVAALAAVAAPLAALPTATTAFATAATAVAPAVAAA